MSRRCKHCNNISYDEEFCCLGCKSAYKIINGLGFKNYYKLKSKDSKGLIKPDLENNLDISSFVTSNNDFEHEINLNIQGLHCAACVWLVENILNKNPNVVKARINLTQKSLFLKWKGRINNFYDMTKIIQEIGYKLLPLDKELIKSSQAQENKSLLLSLSIAGFGAGNLMLLSFGLWFASSEEMGIQTRNLFHFFSALIALPIIIFSGQIFFKSAIKSLKKGHANMDLVITIAIILTAIASTIKTFSGAEHIYFDSAVMLIFFLLIGRFLEQKVRKKAFDIANEFSMLNASYGRVEKNNKIEIIPSQKLKKGMILVIASGEKIAADGEIIEGQSEIDNSLINGESQAKSVKIGDQVFAGTINLNSPIKVLITIEPKNSILAKIIALTQKIDQDQNSYIKSADKLAKLYIPLTHGLAFITFIFWFFYSKGGLDQAFSNSIAVLIITCPCALALAIPISQTILTSQMLKRGIIIKSGSAIEKLPQINTIIFDKTGSITLGKPTLSDIFTIKNSKKTTLSLQQKEKYLKIAAAMSQNSQHPIAKAICDSYSGPLKNIKTSEIKGQGLKAKLENKQVLLGKAQFCQIKNVAAFESAIDKDSNLGSYLKYEDEEVFFSFSDQIKEDAQFVINKLRQKGKKIILLSGDNEKNVKKIANSLKIKQFYFDQSPLDKANFLENLHQNNEKFIMVGDGINDGPALKLADVSLSFSKASDLAQSVSDIIIQGPKLQPISNLLNSSQVTLKIMQQNMNLSLAYNLIAVPFAMAGYVVPLIAALAMSSSSILVLLNSLRIKNLCNNIYC